MKRLSLLVTGAAIGAAALRLAQAFIRRDEEFEAVDIVIPPGPAVAPQPVGEMVVKVDAPAHVVVIWTATDDAAAWVEEMAEQFGTLYEPEESGLPYVLIVSPLYMPVEVGQFLYVGYHQEGEEDGHNPFLS